MTKQTEKPSAKRLAGTILTRLKKNVHEVDVHTAKVRRLTAQVFADTYAWVESMMSVGSYVNNTEAIRDLAGTLRKNRTTVFNWYYYGEFMREHAMRVGIIDPQSVRLLRHYHKSMRRADFLATLTVVKEGADTRKVGPMIKKTRIKIPANAEKSAVREIVYLRQRRMLNKTNLRFRAVGFKLLCQETLEEEVEIHVISKKSKKVLFAIPEED